MKGILACNKLGYIGLNGGLPFRSKDDLKHFRELTRNSKVLVGSATYENMPKFKDLTFLVVGKNYNTLEYCLSQKPDWCIGGAKLFDSVKHLITEFHLSIIDDYTIGDVKIPNYEMLNTIIYNFCIDSKKEI